MHNILQIYTKETNKINSKYLIFLNFWIFLPIVDLASNSFYLFCILYTNEWKVECWVFLQPLELLFPFSYEIFFTFLQSSFLFPKSKATKLSMLDYAFFITYPLLFSRCLSFLWWFWEKQHKFYSYWSSKGKQWTTQYRHSSAQVRVLTYSVSDPESRAFVACEDEESKLLMNWFNRFTSTHKDVLLIDDPKYLLYSFS